MLVEEVMHTDVKTIGKESTVQEAAEEMKKFRIGSLIVVKNSKLLGIITERDILDKVVAEGESASETKIKDIMTKEVIMISPDRDAGEAAEIMSEKKIKKLPVIKGDKLIGIVTASDLCAAEPKMMEQLAALMLMPKKKAVAG